MKKIVLVFFLALTAWNLSNAQFAVVTNSDLDLRIGGDVQVDSRNYIDNPAAVKNGFLVRRARIDIRGVYAKVVEFRLLPSFGQGRAEIDDAYASITFFPELKLRAGKFKTPLGLERLQSPTNTFFIEAGLPNNLIPNRDIGFELSGVFVNNIINYSVGLYNGVIDGATEDAEVDLNKELTGRIFLQPFNQDKESLVNKLGFGVAASFGKQTGTIASTRLSTYRTAGQNAFFRFRDSVYANGNRTRIVPQAYLYTGRFGFLGEAVINKQKLARGKNLTEETTNSWQATFSFLLTDDNASYNGVKPNANFDVEAGGWGAFELVFRINNLSVDEKLFPVFANAGNSAKSANEWTAGFNWYLNPVFKISLDYANTSFKSFGTAAALHDEKLVFTRIQAAF